MPAMNYARIAGLYDVYAQTDIDVPFFIEEANGCRNVLEITSGTGRLSIPLIEAGVNLTCLDSSAEMLAILHKKLKEKSLSAKVYEMDACEFSLPEKYDLIIIPFNSFSEITEPTLQESALSLIRAHLAANGRLIVTLHNPAVRLKNVDGQVHLRGKFPLPDESGTLFLSSSESYDPATHLVKGAQFYEIYTALGNLEDKRYVDLEFHLHSKETFENLAASQGFVPVALYGDYSRDAFNPDSSPFMIWILHK
jgi:SAM-dependent methyltransferase